MQMLMKLTNNEIRAIDVSEGIKMEVQVENWIDATSTIYHCVNLVFCYKEDKYNIISLMFSEETENYREQMSTVIDLLSFVAQPSINMIFGKMSKGDMICDLVAIVDDCIKSNISPVDSQIVEDAFTMYNTVCKIMLNDSVTWETNDCCESIVLTDLSTEKEEK